MRTTFTAEYVRSILNYDPDTGLFTWKWRNDVGPEWNTRRAHCTAGGIQLTRYIGICINNEQFLAHRLAWLYMTGSWPEGQVDHINGQRADNRWANLRVATSSENKWNRGKAPNNTSSYKGVRLHKSSGLWHARIGSMGKEYSLGYYKTAEEAAVAYQEGAKKYHGEFAKW